MAHWSKAYKHAAAGSGSSLCLNAMLVMLNSIGVVASHGRAGCTPAACMEEEEPPTV